MYCNFIKNIFLRLYLNRIYFLSNDNEKTCIFSFSEENVSDAHTNSAKNYLEKSSTITTSSECTSYASSSSVSNLGPSSSQNEFHNIAGTSRMEYGLTTFLDYNEQRKFPFYFYFLRIFMMFFISSFNFYTFIYLFGSVKISF